MRITFDHVYCISLASATHRTHHHCVSVTGSIKFCTVDSCPVLLTLCYVWLLLSDSVGTAFLYVVIIVIIIISMFRLHQLRATIPSVSLSIMWLQCLKMAGQIEVFSRVRTLGDLRNIVMS